MQELDAETGKTLLALQKDGQVNLDSPMPGLTDRPVVVRLNARFAPNRSTFIGYWYDLKFVEFEVLMIDGRYKFTILP